MTQVQGYTGIEIIEPDAIIQGLIQIYETGRINNYGQYHDCKSGLAHAA